MTETLDLHTPAIHPELDPSSALEQARSTYNEVLVWVTDVNLKLNDRHGLSSNTSNQVEYVGGRDAYISSWLLSEEDNVDNLTHIPRNTDLVMDITRGRQESLLDESAAGLQSLHASGMPIQQKVEAVDTVWRAAEALSGTLVEPRSVNESMRKLVGFMRVLTQRGEFSVDLIKSTPSMRNAYRLMGAVENTLLGDTDVATSFLSDMEESPGLQKIFSTLLTEESNKEYESAKVTPEESKEHLEEYISSDEHGLKWPEVTTLEAQQAEIGVSINTDLATVSSIFKPDSHGRYFAFSEFPDYMNADKTKPSARGTYNSWGADGARDLVEREAGFRGNIFTPYPVYGAVASDVEPMGSATSYGEFAAIWVKDEVLERPGTNFVIGDSTYRASNVNYPDAKEAYRHVLDKKLVQGSFAMPESEYIEARLPSVRVNDIEKISIKYNAMALHKLSTSGVEGMQGLVETISSNGIGVEIVTYSKDDFDSATEALKDIKGVTISLDK